MTPVLLPVTNFVSALRRFINLTIKAIHTTHFFSICPWAVWLVVACLIPMDAWSHQAYSSRFTLAENPIAENGNWINGRTTGLDWANVCTANGIAFGTQSGTSTGARQYDDSTAILTGTWGPDQTVEATVSVKNASGSVSVFEEVELRLRTTITAHSITGYEINCSVSANEQNFYMEIVRWNGPLGSFTYLNRTTRHCGDGDVLKAKISGSTITVYLNGLEVLQTVDKTYTNGNPGIGFYLHGASGLNANYGFSDFAATTAGQFARVAF